MSPSPAPCGPTTSATSQNTSGPNSKQLLFRSSYRLNALEGFRGPILCNLGAPPLPPVTPTTSATSQNTSGPNSKQLLFRSSFPSERSLEGFKGGYLMYLGAPPLPPVTPRGHPPHRRIHLGANFQTSFISIFSSKSRRN